MPTFSRMALSCFRCAGYSDLEHARDCPHRAAPPPTVVAELPWPTGDDGEPVSLARAVELAAALDEAAGEPTYWVEFTSTDDAELDDALRVIEDGYNVLGAIRRYCEHYGVGAIYGDGSGVRGAVTRAGAVVPEAPNPRDVAMG